MAALDTNVLVRLITRDHPEQTAKSMAFLEGQGGEGIWIPPTVLVETAWVLERSYRWSPADIHQALLITARCGVFKLDDPCHAAIETYGREGARGIGFADCLILQAAKDRHQTPIATFDQRFSRLPGVLGL